jgi:hypothetical protein
MLNNDLIFLKISAHGDKCLLLMTLQYILHRDRKAGADSLLYPVVTHADLCPGIEDSSVINHFRHE